MDIFTIGHSNYIVDRFLDMLRHYQIDCIVDIRGTPYSKYNIQYNKEVIEKTLKDKGYIYIYMGKEFAAQREDKSIYTNEGYADFEKVKNNKDFISGIERLKNGCRKGFNIALMGAKQDPINCHRCILVGKELRSNGFKVKHILDDYSIASQEELEDRLLEKYYKGIFQVTFDGLAKNKISREEMIKQCYRNSNAEIGFRLEKN